jgi:hypothetical protein
MKISIFACGFNINNGKPTQRGACVARLQYVDDHNRTSVRVISEPVGNSTGPQCDIKAVILGLMSIKATPTFRKMPIELFVSSYVVQLLERNEEGFKINPKKNIELIRRLREKFLLFANITAQTGSKEQLQQVMNIAKTTVDTEIASDSGTIIT